jgi:16S rRNA (uracil1498-N3)-methyltransferase
VESLERDASTVRISGEAAHHVLRVLRLSPGDALEVFDGRGHARAARIRAVEGAEAVVDLLEARDQPARRRVTVVQGLPKADKLDWVLQKCTELGASQLVPAVCQRSVVRLTVEKARERTERWQAIAAEAARQCGRNDVPPVRAPMPLATVPASLEAGTVLLVLDEEERAVRLGSVLRRLPPGAPLALVAGPEGGLTREEVEALVAAGATAVSLGTLVLRTETACLAALAIVRHLDGELG